MSTLCIPARESQAGRVQEKAQIGLATDPRRSSLNNKAAKMVERLLGLILQAAEGLAIGAGDGPTNGHSRRHPAESSCWGLSFRCAAHFDGLRRSDEAGQSLHGVADYGSEVVEQGVHNPPDKGTTASSSEEHLGNYVDEDSQSHCGGHQRPTGAAKQPDNERDCQTGYLDNQRPLVV